METKQTQTIVNLIYPHLNDLNNNLKNEKCKVCGEKTYKEIPWLDRKVLAVSMCACERKKEIEEAETKKKNYKQDNLDRYARISLVENKTLDEVFENAKIDDDNKEIYQIVKIFCTDFKKAMSKNTGLYIYGKRGRGKSFLANCIYNYLKRDFSIIYINLNMYSNELKKGYEEKKAREIELLNAVKQADLMIIDDIGTENLTEWLAEKVFNLVNYREMVKKPLLVTSNCDFDTLEQKYDKYDEYGRIRSRIQGMCMDLELTGKDRRENDEKFSWLMEV